MSFKALVYACSPSAIHPFFKRIEASNVGSRLASGIFWSMAGSVISRGLMLCATILVARLLGKAVYGELGMIQSTIGMFGVFAGFGLGLTATKHVAEFRKSNPERAGRIIGISGLFAMGTGSMMALGLLIFAPWLAEQTINAPHLVDVLRIGALILFFNALNGAQTGALAGFEAFKTIAHVNLFVGLISFPVLVCGAYWGGLTGAVWALTINLGINWLLNHLALRKEALRHKIPFTFSNCTRELPILLSFSLPATLCEVMVGPANWVCRAFLTSQPNGYDELGILTAALLFQNLIMFVSGMLSAPLLSMVSNAGAKISNELGTVNILATWLLGVVVAIPLLCFPELVQLAFGSDYATHSFKVTFTLLVFCTTIMTFKTGLTRILVSNNILWWGFLSNAIWATTLIASASFFVRWGASGLAVSLTIAYLLQTSIVLPLLSARNLLPTKMLFCLESITILFSLVGLVFMNILNVSLLFRSIVFIPAILIIGLAFTRITKKMTTANLPKTSIL